MEKLVIAFLIFTLAQNSEVTNSEYTIEFDTVKIQLAKKELGVSGCEIHYLPKAMLQKFNPTKIVNTNIPKFLKIQSDQNSYWFKICKA